MMKLSKINLKFCYYLSGIVLLCLYYLPFFLFGEESYLIIHDNLDQNMWEFAALKRMHAPYYQNGQFIQIMNGLPGYMLMASKWNITGLLFLLFNPFIAYLINDFLARAVGFLGMALLLDKCILNQDFKYRNIVIFPTAFIFSLLGCYTIYRGLSIMGQPLLLFAFWNLYKDNIKWWGYLIIAIFAFGSSLVLTGIFIGTLLASVWLFGVIRDNRFHFPFFTGLILLAAGYLVAEHTMIFSLFDKSAITPHRVEFQSDMPSVFQQIVNVALNGGLITQYHTGQFWTIFILLPLIYIIFSQKATKFMWYLIVVIGFILLIEFIHPYVTFWFGDKITLIKSFNWTRFTWLLPVLWLVLFTLIIERLLLNSTLKWRFLLSIVFTAGLCCSVAFHNRELGWNMEHMTGIIKPKNPSFREFYDTKLFSGIKMHIGKPDETYRVVSLGIFPSVASYNGFFCLDSYQTLYSLEYKHSFRDIIASELDKNIELKNYFDNWGSRCYLFSAELGNNHLWSKEQNKKIFHLNINTEKLNQLSQKETYIISAVEIVNYESMGLALENVFEGNYWRIHLYRVQ